MIIVFAKMEALLLSLGAKAPIVHVATPTIPLDAATDVHAVPLTAPEVLEIQVAAPEVPEIPVIHTSAAPTVSVSHLVTRSQKASLNLLGTKRGSTIYF